MVSAMGPPGGGRTFITERLKRHYSITSYTELSDESITQIFRVIGMHFFANFDPAVHTVLNTMISSSIRRWRTSCRRPRRPTTSSTSATSGRSSWASA